MIHKLQWKRAVALATAHSHDWATWAAGCSKSVWWDSIPAPVPIPVPESWEAAYEAWQDWDSPFVYPGLGPSPVHTTGTGRCVWHVRDDGTTIVSICRPMYPLGSCCENRRTGAACFCSQVVLRGYWDSEGSPMVVTVEGDYLERHWDALTTCEFALYGQVTQRPPGGGE